MADKPSKPMQHVRKLAMSLPEVEEGTSCNKSAFQARKKSFCFLGQRNDSYNVMVKLVDSLPEAERLQEEFRDRFKVGLHGWTTVTFPHAEAPSTGILEKWIVESYRSLAHKQLVALLPESLSSDPGPAKRVSVKKKVVKKKAVKKKTPAAKKKRSQRK